MSGLARICKQHGSITVIGKDGKPATWVFDYDKNKPTLKSKQKSKTKKSRIMATVTEFFRQYFGIPKDAEVEQNNTHRIITEFTASYAEHVLRQNESLKNKVGYLVSTEDSALIVIADNIADCFDKLNDKGYKNYNLVKAASFDLVV